MAGLCKAFSRLALAARQPNAHKSTALCLWAARMTQSHPELAPELEHELEAALGGALGARYVAVLARCRSGAPLDLDPVLRNEINALDQEFAGGRR